MGGPGYVEEHLRDHAHGRSSGHRGHFTGEVVGSRDVGRDPSAVAHEYLPEGPEPGTPKPHLDMAVEGLHAQQDHGFPRKTKGMQAAHGYEGMTEEGRRHGCQPRSEE